MTISAWLRVVAALGACFLPLLASAAQGNARVLLIGTFHFANPGLDQHNVKAVDVLAPQRQGEIRWIVDSLARFRPTHVAVEWPAATVDERYPKYLEGTLPESRNEVVQLGFRLAQQHGLKRVHGIDVEGTFPYGPVAEWARANGKEADLQHAGAEETAYITALQERASLGAVMRYMNEPGSIARNHAFYPVALEMGRGNDQPGVKLMSAWHERNLGMCARVLQAIEGGDRMVVIVGQGHVYLVRQCLQEAPGVELEDPLDYLPRE
jgi:hypothetical protein